MTENLATAVEQNSTSIEQMSRSIEAVAQNGRRITDAAAGAAASATQLERSTESVAALARRAEEADGAGLARCRGRRRRRPALDPGDLPAAGINVAVGHGDERDG